MKAASSQMIPATWSEPQVQGYRLAIPKRDYSIGSTKSMERCSESGVKPVEGMAKAMLPKVRYDPRSNASAFVCISAYANV